MRIASRHLRGHGEYMARRKSHTSGSPQILSFVAEAGMLKRVKRSGWWVVGIKDPESVADHSFSCAVIGYALAHMEGVLPYKVLLMTLLNDIHEARINDLHKMAQRYVHVDAAEDRAFAEQLKSLPLAMRRELTGMRREYRMQKTQESIIARDADILECLIQAKEYRDYGYKEAVKFMKKAPRFLKTKSARALWNKAKTMDFIGWWESLTTFRR